MRHRWLGLGLCCLLAAASAEERVAVCYGYGCLAQDEIRYTESRLEQVGRQLAVAVDAAGEREILSRVMGQLYAWAGEQSDIRNDRGGNYADAGVPGKMDCIDHSTSTTRLLRVLEKRGMLRFHRVGEPVLRHALVVFPVHYSAMIEMKDGGGAYVVDSWFVDNGEPAVILPLDEWMNGAGPDV